MRYTKKHKSKNKKTRKYRKHKKTSIKINKTSKNVGRGPKLQPLDPSLSFKSLQKLFTSSNSGSNTSLIPITIADNPIRSSNFTRRPYRLQTNLSDSSILPSEIFIESNIKDTNHDISPEILNELSEQIDEQLVEKLPEVFTNTNKIEMKVKKKVKINTPDNDIKEYELGSSERNWKKPKQIISEIPKCKKERSPIPCKLKRTVFTTMQDYKEYLRLKQNSNNKSKSHHYNTIESLLSSQNSVLNRKKKY